MKRKHFTEKYKIRSISSEIRNSFDDVYTTSKKTLEKSIIDNENLIKLLTIKTNEILNKIEHSDNYEPSDKDSKIFTDLYEAELIINSSKDSLLSLSEMRIIFLFKTIENSIEEIACIAFSKIEKNNFFRWESIKKFFKENGVDFDKLEGYEELNKLRIVNNNIKHSSHVDSETKKISYWSNEISFTYKNLDEFYSNIHEQIIKFMKIFGEAIIVSVYEITDEKLEEISKELFDRLDSERVGKLIIKLNEKIKENIPVVNNRGRTIGDVPSS